MDLPLEFKGKWFLPSNPDNFAYGVAKFDPNTGTTLELLGTFSGEFHESFDMNQDIICGVTSDSKKVTLYKCFVRSHSGLSLNKGEESGEPLVSYYVNHLLEGFHYFEVKDMLFEKVTAQLFNLGEWAGYHGFANTRPTKKDIAEGKGKIVYKAPDPIVFPIKGGLMGKIHYGVNVPGSAYYTDSKTITQSPYLTFESDGERSLEDMLGEMAIFQNFLTLALYQGTYPKKITLLNKKHEIDLGEEFGEMRYDKRPVQLYMSSSLEDKPKKTLLDLQMLFCYRSIKEHFVETIQTWYKLHDRLRPVFNLLFEQFYNGHRFTENSFLNLAQAAETFHARMHDTVTKMPKDDYDKLKNGLRKTSNPDYLDWLNGIFPFGNNPNLQHRLDFLVDVYWMS